MYLCAALPVLAAQLSCRSLIWSVAHSAVLAAVFEQLATRLVVFLPRYRSIKAAMQETFLSGSPVLQPSELLQVFAISAVDAQQMLQPVTSAPQPSALLRCRSQLNADTWAQVLLPKLVEHGSEAAVALSCSQLRDLCYSSKQSIKLGALLNTSDPCSLMSQVENLSMHFPNVETASMAIQSFECCHNLPYIIPDLARLPRLDGLSLGVDCKQHPMLSCFMLRTIRAHMPFLRGLDMCLKHPFGWLHAKDMHLELGGMTQLTRLCLTLDNMKVEASGPYAPLNHLGSLTNLQHLTLWGEWDGEDHYARYYGTGAGHRFGTPTLPVEVVSALTNLTRLELNVYDLGASDDLGGCVNLQHLAICLKRSKDLQQHDMIKLGSADCQSLATLTRLTELRLLNVDLSKPKPETCEALSKLSKLSKLQVAAAVWDQALLPALQACTRLTELCGQWPWSGSSSKGAAPTLPQVLVLVNLAAKFI